MPPFSQAGLVLLQTLVIGVVFNCKETFFRWIPPTAKSGPPDDAEIISILDHPRTYRPQPSPLSIFIATIRLLGTDSLLSNLTGVEVPGGSVFMNG